MRRVLIIIVANIAFAQISAISNAQVITTNKVDYIPGERVIASGQGWEPFEIVDLNLKEDLSTHADVDSSYRCDVTGKFTNVIYEVSEHDLGVFFLLTATGRTSGNTATITFNDASGDYSIDFSAYNPEFYDRISYLPGMSLPSGNVTSPLGGTDHDKTVESLNPQNLGLGQIVAYEYFVRADAGGACFNDQITIGGEFLTETSNGSLFGFDGAVGVVAAFVDTNPLDIFNSDGGTQATVSGFSWNLVGNTIESSVDVMGMDPGDEITVEIWVVLQQSIEAGIGGNVKTRLGAAAISGTCETNKTTINTGNQEIPLLQVGDFHNSDVNVSISKTDQSDQVIIGDDIIYTLSIYNAGPSVANIVDITDILDTNTTYNIGSWSDNDITGSDWTFASDGNTLTLSSQYLNIGESVEITLTAKSNNDNNTPTSNTGGDACTGAEDVCNNVSISTISNENDVSDNSDSQATGILCQNIGISLGADPNISLGETMASLSYTSLVGSPDLYSIDFNAAAEAVGFLDVTNATLNSSPFYITVSGTAVAGIYDATIKVISYVNGCESTLSSFSITIDHASPPEGGLLFESCGNGSLITTITDSWNGAWIDYDNDGWEDVFVTDKNNQSANKLYRNNGDGIFVEIASPPLTTLKELTISSTWADINNDGLIDVFVVNATETKSTLYINNGEGNFTATTNSGIYEHPDYFHGASWADYDNDGFVDLLVTNFFETRFHHLYHNNGDETFTSVYNTPITTESHRSMTPVWTDYNHDGLVDVFIPNGNDEPNSLFKNIGNGQFSKVTSGAIVTDSYNAVGAAWGDYNNDGWMDLFVANASGQQNNMYKNNGNGTFTKIISSVVLDDFGNSHGVSWADVDNDGDLDLYVTNDVGAKYLYINDGEGNFTINIDEPLTTDFGTSFGHAWADYNKDGFLDAMVFTHDSETNQLFCNLGNENHWINIKLQGINSNYSAVGAQIRILVDGEWQVRQVSAQSGFGSQNSLRQHIGFGTATLIDSIEVTWPSGYVQYLTDVSADQFITIVENDASLVKGLAYNDTNGNCIKDPEEDIIANSTFILSPIDVTVVTNAYGEYEIRLPEGNYDFQLNNSNDYWEQLCSGSLAVGSNFNTEYAFDLGIKPKVEGHDLYISYGATAWKRGFTSQSEIQYGNAGTSDVYNVTITVTYPQETIVQSASTVWSSESNNNYTWIIDTMKAGSEFYIQMTDSVTLNSSIGQLLPVSVEISAAGTDLNPTNNLDFESIEIVGAIDPNDMLVSPKGAGREGFIDKDQILSYTIRFQNVGTYLASRAVILNKIPENMDLNSFKVLNSSHSYYYILDMKGNLKVTFNNINLLDSTSNEPESHGFFKYSIQLKSTLNGGEKIYNSALITFDYEDPLRTNELLNTVRFEGLDQPLKLIVYPNPAKEEINLVVHRGGINFRNNFEIERISIYSLDGSLHLNQAGNKEAPGYLDISSLRGGLYMVRVMDIENNVVIAKLLVD